MIQWLQEAPFTPRLGANPSRGLQFLFDIQGELNHALGHLFDRQTREVLEHQLLDIEPHQITQLQRATARGENKIAMPLSGLLCESAMMRMAFQSSPIRNLPLSDSFDLATLVFATVILDSTG